jgi:uncharacterized protein YkwD
MTRARSGLVPLCLFVCVQAFAGEPEATQYPRKLGEIKAMIQVLAPEKSAGVANTYIQRLKQYRYVCGVPYEDIQWDSQLALLAQKASLVCSKLGTLTHTPTKPAGMADDEYKLAKTGAGSSNLYMGVVQPAACIDGWMDDSDDKNIDRVGHRRWCINPTMVKTGFGSEGKFAAMHAHDTSRANVPDWDFVAYPARGYMPMELFGNRHAWSVSPNTRKYEVPKGGVKASITPANEKGQPAGAALKLDYFNVEFGGFGSGPAIIFRPEAFAMAGDARYVVEITGLKPKGKQPATLSFLVHFINLQKAPDSPDSRAVYTTYFQQRLKAAQALSDRVDQLEALAAISEDKFLGCTDPSVVSALRTALTDLTKDSALKREQEASQRYRLVADFELKAGKKKDQLVQAAFGYRDLAQAFKETRAGRRAADDFERLKKTAQ